MQSMVPVKSALAQNRIENGLACLLCQHCLRAGRAQTIGRSQKVLTTDGFSFRGTLILSPFGAVYRGVASNVERLQRATWECWDDFPK
jgi:hypothetical protein